MLVEWYFLFSVLSGTFDPQTGWQTVERYRVVAPSLAECETKRLDTWLRYREAPIPGGGVVITGCQPVPH